MTTALDNLKVEVEKVVLNWLALFNNSEIPLEAYRDIEFEEQTDQWQMSSGLGPDWSSLYFRFSLHSMAQAAFSPLIDCILSNTDLASKLPFDPTAKHARERYNQSVRGWMWHVFVRPCLDIGFTKKQNFEFNKRFFDQLFEQFLRELESPTIIRATYFTPLMHLKLSRQIDFSGNLKLRAITLKEMEAWLNPDSSHTLFTRPEEIVQIQCGLEAQYEFPKNLELAYVDQTKEPSSIEQALRVASIEYNENKDSIVRALRLLTEGHIYPAFTSTEITGLLWHAISFLESSRPYPILSWKKTLGVDDTERLLNLRGLLTEGTNASFLDLAVRRWSGAADRLIVPSRSVYEDMLIDFWVGLESLFSPDSNQEVKFRSALRIAAFLGDTPQERLRLHEEARDSYDWRSAIVHGDQEKIKKLEKKNNLSSVTEKTRSMLRNAIMRVAESKNRFEPQHTERHLLERS